MALWVLLIHFVISRSPVQIRPAAPDPAGILIFLRGLAAFLWIEPVSLTDRGANFELEAGYMDHEETAGKWRVVVRRPQRDKNQC